MADHELDCRGQQCPKPIIQISKKMQGLASGDRLRVEADDPAFHADVTAWVSMRGERLESFRAEGVHSVAVLLKQ